jgi:hypothetical protein
LIKQHDFHRQFQFLIGQIQRKHDLFIVTVATLDACQNHWIGYNSEGRKPTMIQSSCQWSRFFKRFTTYKRWMTMDKWWQKLTLYFSSGEHIKMKLRQFHMKIIIRNDNCLW